MACRSDIQAFLNMQLSYPCSSNGQTYTYTIAQYARWVSYQSNTDGEIGTIPVSLIVAHWGIETGWGTSTGFQNKNLAGMTRTCDNAIPSCGTWYGSSGQAFRTFCTWRDSVRAYSQLIRIGYKHVAYGNTYGTGGATGYRGAAIALGKGYGDNYSYQTSYCFTSLQTVASTSPRLWDAGGYNNGNGPGSKLSDVIAANDCLSTLGVQTADPGVFLC